MSVSQNSTRREDSKKDAKISPIDKSLFKSSENNDVRFEQ